jgi:putative lipoprotein
MTAIERPLALLVAGALVAMVSGCALFGRGRHDTPARVTGTIRYLERVALPPDATVHLAIEDTSRSDVAGAVIARRAFRPAGQVPIPFAVELPADRIDPRHRYGVRAQIRGRDGRLLWTTTAAHPVLTAGHPTDVVVLVRRVPAPVAPTPGLQVYECTGLVFSVRVQDATAQVFLPDRTLALPQVPSGSGSKYTDGSDTFWSHGKEALLEAGDRAWQGCRNNPARTPWEEARLRGVDFRALGNEPGWQLEIENGRRMVLVTDGGANQLSTAAPPPAVDAARRQWTYRAGADGREVEVVVQQAPCADAMSGEPFPYRVTVTLDGDSLTGCGRVLR